jgi:hypothetical protein
MRQVLARNLRPGDVIESTHGAACVTDLPATCYERDLVSVMVPVTTLWRSRELTFAPTDFVPVVDHPVPALIQPFAIFSPSPASRV